MAGLIVSFLREGWDQADKIASVIGVLVALVALVGAPPALRALWWMWRGKPTERSVAALEEVAEQLAVAVRSQWDAEAALRRINDPYPLPVVWRPADDDLAEPWPQLKEVALAWPGGPPGDPAHWPQEVAGLAGRDGGIGEVFTDRIPTRRLVILGEPGAGKSVLMVRLLQDLLARRTEGKPVPVLFSLASWEPRRPLMEWLADQLRRSHPGLRAPATDASGLSHGDLAEALLETGRILPLLDGFDELPSQLHSTALDALNRALTARRPLVLAARAAAYRAALSGSDSTVLLNGAAAIHLLPLDAERAAAYLRRDAGGQDTMAAARWDAVIGQLGTRSPVGLALSTPLGLFLARTIYNPRPGTATGTPAPHPDELCDSAALPDRAAVDQHLFHAFIPAAYAPYGPRPPRWNPEQAERAFTFLARFQETHRHGSPDLAWWELRKAVPPVLQYLTGGLIFGLTGALAAKYGSTDLVEILAVFTGALAGAIIGRRTYGAAGTYLFGLIGMTVGGLTVTLGAVLSEVYLMLSGTSSPSVAGFMAGAPLGCLIFRPARRSVGPSTGRHQLREGLAGGLRGFMITGVAAGGWLLVDYGLVALLLGGLAGGLAGEFTNRCVRRRAGGLPIGFVGGLVAASLFVQGDAEVLGLLVSGLAGAIATALLGGAGRGLVPRAPEAISTIGASKALAADRRTSLLVSLAFVPVVGITAGLLFGSDFGNEFGIRPQWSVPDHPSQWTIGLLAGVATALALTTTTTVWPYFAMARTYLALRRRVPRDLMTFLQDAHEHRGILRQVGPVYQFRHIDLQHHLARQH
ncbi:NACHT domain-containing protein [Streptomyces chrestomyceticus]|uniref:NACHT domain-containing protein n=1 Tax=Streptomyces chrestomyceticus TaxID=68185 RepID=UPI003676B327